MLINRATRKSCTANTQLTVLIVTFPLVHGRHIALSLRTVVQLLDSVNDASVLYRLQGAPRCQTLDDAAVTPTEHLDCVTKQRAKGPAGRRLPRHARPRPADADAAQHRSESLPRLEDPATRCPTSPVCPAANRACPIDAANVPDHSDFDRCWFIRSAGDAGRASRRTTPPPLTRSFGRYWNCNFL